MSTKLKPLPYYAFFWEAYRASRRVQKMNYIERGLYRHLLDECWVEGGFPSSFPTICEILDCPIEVLHTAWTKLAPCFYLDGDLFRNEEMEELRTTKDKERVIKSISGKIGGQRRTHTDRGSQASAKQVLSSCHIEEKRKEENRKEENRKEKSYDSQNSTEFAAIACPYEKIKNLWHEKLPTLNKVQAMTDKRENTLKRLWRKAFVEAKLKTEEEGLEWFAQFFQHISESKFLMGRTHTEGRAPFNCTFDYVIDPNNAVKIIEGNYHKNPSKSYVDGRGRLVVDGVVCM
ncbi:hypothetical protein AOC28_08220 [Polynucleobacter sp. MWH-Adler-W8]|nr:hypothetical protein AOC28_08220 [Polynucleobacter sp. MWH-Adler-W8]